MKPFEVGINRPILLLHKHHLEHAAAVYVRHPSLDSNALDLDFSLEGAERVAEMGFNWVFVSFDDGFAPEVEAQGYERFAAAVRYYKQQSIQIVGIIGVSTAVATGSYAKKDWYALDPNGKRLLHSAQRYFVQLHHPEWQASVAERIQRLAETGVDAIGLYIEGQGAFGLDLSMAAIGLLGSYDAANAEAFTKATGNAALPQIWNPTRRNVQDFIRWRAAQVHEVIAAWAVTVREKLPSKPVFVQLDDPMANNLLLNRGIAYRTLRDNFDYFLIRDRNWYFNTANSTTGPLLPFTHARYTVLNAHEIGGGLARTVGLGTTTANVERTHPVRHYSQMLLEGLLVDVPTVLPGLAVRQNGQFSSILHRRYATLQQVLKSVNDWQVEWVSRLAGRRNVSPLAVLVHFAEDAAGWQIERALVNTILQVLQEAGYPLRVVSVTDNWRDVQVLIVPSDRMLPQDDQRIQEFKASGGQLVLVSKSSDRVTERPVWRSLPLRTISIVPLPLRPAMRIFNRSVMRLVRWYHEIRWFRRVVQWLSSRNIIAQRLTPNQPLTPEMRHNLLRAIPKGIPYIETTADMLFMFWQEQDGTLQYNLLNHEAEAQSVTLHTANLQAGSVYNPGSNEPPQPIVGSSFILSVNIAKIIRVEPSTDESSRS